MSTPTKKNWQSLTTNIAEDIEHVEWEVRDVLKEAEQRIENTKNTIGWDWDYFVCDGVIYADVWDAAIEEEEGMLDYAAKFNYTWSDVSRKIHQARQLLQDAFNELNELRMEDMAKAKEINEKWTEVINFAREHATGEGLHKGYRWLQDAFNEYLDMTDKTPGYGMGGQPGSMLNREVLAEKICLRLGNHIGGDHTITDDQEARLRESLKDIVENTSQHKALKL